MKKTAKKETENKPLEVVADPVTRRKFVPSSVPRAQFYLYPKSRPMLWLAQS